MVNYSTILGVVQTILKNPSHPREIAKQLKVSHATVLAALKQLEEEQAATYTREGKNKTYKLTRTIQAHTHKLQAEHHKLLTTINKYPHLAPILEEIKQTTTADIIMLFGSYAKQTADKNSDIDLYANTTTTKEKQAIQQVHTKISAQIGRLNPEEPISKEIMNDHVIIKGAEKYYEQRSEEHTS